MELYGHPVSYQCSTSSGTAIMHSLNMCDPEFYPKEMPEVKMQMYEPSASAHGGEVSMNYLYGLLNIQSNVDTREFITRCN